MNKETLRSVEIFVAISIVLTAFVVGGVFLTKNLETSYNNTHTQKQVAVNRGDHSSQQASSSPQTENSDSSSTEGSVHSPTTPNPSPSPVQKPSPQPVSQPSMPNSSKTEAQVPSTGIGSDVLITSVFLSLSVYFGLLIVKARSALRRYPTL